MRLHGSSDGRGGRVLRQGTTRVAVGDSDVVAWQVRLRLRRRKAMVIAEGDGIVGSGYGSKRLRPEAGD
ncbi:hypothetical protein B296_00052441 [Ensete ventricosum]|uniref:Uncharacterized protein n=1 Tax=Ensete ventricosum TaxID=4639 RepID=A0A426WW05_ENSVE|nr:hypothetical protein B296_00052441 [Ensete ventricosum]